MLTLTLFAGFLVTQVGDAQHAPSKAGPQVRIDAGTLQGATDASAGVLVFRGVPYAAPPTKDLRWGPPQTVARWTGIRSAETFGSACPSAGPPGIQSEPRSAATRAAGEQKDEDCLYLNVWTATISSNERRPVLVWLHGGGGVGGSGAIRSLDGSALARKGVVVVTLNYRLGLLGFLAHPALSAESPHRVSGNYALLDQIAGLKWVQRNIMQFGGDPKRVTVGGDSAGARSVATLIVSPFAAGLFQRAILQSGTGMDDAVESKDAGEAHGLRLATMLGVEGTDAGAAQALRAVSADDLLSTFAKWRFIIGGPPAPTIARALVDGWVIPLPVDQALKRGKFNKVPIIIGTNSDEGTLAIRETPLRNVQEFHQALRRWYFDETGILAEAYPVTDEILPVLQRLWGEEKYGAPTRAFARLASASGARVFLYYFTRVGDGPAQSLGAFHGSQAPFAFGQFTIAPNLGRTPYDSALSQTMSDYWVAFATNGDPNGSGRPSWPLYEMKTDEYLELGRNIAPRQGLRRAQFDALDRLARDGGAIRP
jgi:para-nitrobenzyl esterase